jgi:hypothetical protein
MKNIVTVIGAVLLIFNTFGQAPTVVLSGGGAVCEGVAFPNINISITGNTTTYAVVYAIDDIEQGTLIAERSQTLVPISAGSYTLISVTEIGGTGLSTDPTDLVGVSVSVIENETPDVPTITTPISTLCEGTAYDVLATSTSTSIPPPNVVITWSGSGAGNSSTTSPAIISGDRSVGTKVYIAVASIGVCASASATLLLTVEESASVSLVADPASSCQGDLVTYTGTAYGVSPTEYRWFYNNIEITQTSTNTYSSTLQNSTALKVQVDNSSACFATNPDVVSNEAVVVVTELFTPVLNIRDSIGCEEDGSIILIATDESGVVGTPIIVWTKGGQTIPGETNSTLNVTETGTYTVIYYNRSCQSEDKEDQTVAYITFQDLSVDAFADEAEAEIGKEVTLTSTVTGAVGVVSYEWYSEGQGAMNLSEASISFTQTLVDNYYVEATDDQSGCQAASNQVFSGIIAGFSDTNTSQDILFYPTITAEHFQIKTLGEAELFIYSQAGRLVKAKTVSNQEIISITDLDNGMYVIKIIQGDKVLTYKLIVKK